jgi:hypothetical protein
MNATKRIRIRLEKHELKIFRFGRLRKFFCEICQTETQHLTVSQTAIVLEVSEMNVFQMAESGQVHSTETADGQLLICADSAATFGRIN